MSTKVVGNIFLVSLFIFVLTLFPAAYATGEYLLGAAGAQPTPEEPMPTVPPSPFERSLTLLSGVVTVISGIYGIQKTRSEIAALKLKEVDRQMQLSEIEKLRLELELEKRKLKKEPSKRSNRSRDRIKTLKVTRE